MGVQIVLQRQQLVDSLTRMLTQLGLERQAKQALTLQQYLEQRASVSELQQESEPAVSEPEGEAEAAAAEQSSE
jgi:hypothetical protein